MKNNYIIMDDDYEFLFKISILQTVDRPNNPGDEEIINDYIEQNYGIADYILIPIPEIENIVYIDESYYVEK